MRLSRYEMETVINFNAGGKTAVLYTCDPVVIRKMDSLAAEYPDVFRCIGGTKEGKTYELPRTAVTFRKPRKLTETQRAAARERMRQINRAGREKKADVTISIG